jgi:hypothetical protein
MRAALWQYAKMIFANQIANGSGATFLQQTAIWSIATVGVAARIPASTAFGAKREVT